MIAPLRIEFDVACTPEHAFRVWTTGINAWWPADHTVTNGDDLRIVLQAGVGGRIFEQTADGVEHQWGEVTEWDPPRLLGYLWHLRRDRADATEVQIHFTATDVRATHILIEHRGWERLGRSGEQWREQNNAGWNSLVPHYLDYLAAIGKGDPT